MIGSIHDCVVDIKGGRKHKVLLRHGDQYQTLDAESVAGIEALDHLHFDIEKTIGIFTPHVPTHVIYEEAGEPVPVIPAETISVRKPLTHFHRQMFLEIQRDPNKLLAHYAMSLLLVRVHALQLVDDLIERNLVTRSPINDRLKPIADANFELIEERAEPEQKYSRCYGHRLEPVRALLARGGEWTVQQICQETGYRDHNVRQQLRTLLARNIVRKIKNETGFFCAFVLIAAEEDTTAARESIQAVSA